LNETDLAFVQSKTEVESYIKKVSRRAATDLFIATMKTANQNHVDYVVLTGDIMSFPSTANLEIVKAETERLTMPYLYTLGNHDWQFMFLEEWNDNTRARNYPKFHPFTNGNPAFQNVNINGINIITIDNSNYQITEEQLAFFESQLELNMPSLLFIHIPLYIPSLAVDVHHKWKAPISNC
jgi:predicted MPP superfamily phosphohydrolase